VARLREEEGASNIYIEPAHRFIGSEIQPVEVPVKQASSTMFKWKKQKKHAQACAPPAQTCVSVPGVSCHDNTDTCPPPLERENSSQTTSSVLDIHGNGPCVDFFGNVSDTCTHCIPWGDCLSCFPSSPSREVSFLHPLPSGGRIPLRWEHDLVHPQNRTSESQFFPPSPPPSIDTCEEMFDNCDVSMFSDETVKLAKNDFRAVRKNCKYAKCRKGVPTFSVPNEVWRFVFGIYNLDDRAEGLGSSNKVKAKCFEFQKWIFQLFCLIRHTSLAPVQWHNSKAFSLPKKSAISVDVVFDAQRTVHTLDPLGKSFYRHILFQGNLPEPTMSEFGYIRGRRRESAIKLQLIVQNRLSACNISHDTNSYDMRNAFASLNFTIMTEVLSFLFDSKDWPFVKQRFANSSTCTPAIGLNLFFSMGSGALPGDRIAAEEFRTIFHTAVVKPWIQNDKESLLTTTCPVTDKIVNIGKSAYADDLCDKNTYQSPPSPSQLLAKHAQKKEQLNSLLASTGIVQNTSKQETILTLRGAGSRNAYKAAQSSEDGHKIQDMIKYLGVWLTYDGSSGPEIRARLNAAWKRWNIFKPVWYSHDVEFSVRVIVFKSLVLNTLIAALDAFCLSDSEQDRLTSFICKRARALLLGKAHTTFKSDDGSEKHNSSTNVEVLRKCKLLPVHLELCLRRLKWFQFTLKRPSSAGSMLAAWLKDLEWDDSGQNPWLYQLCDDLSKLVQLSDKPLLLISFLSKDNFDPVECFLNHELKQEILNCDLLELREIWIRNMTNVFAHSRRGDADSPGHEFKCDVPDCSFVTSSHAKLIHHLVSSKAEGHNQRNMLNFLTPTNQCIFCSTVFSDIITTQHHVAKSFENNRCKADCSYKFSKPKDPESLKCPWSTIQNIEGETICEFEASHLKELHMHIADHLDWSPKLEIEFKSNYEKPVRPSTGKRKTDCSPAHLPQSFVVPLAPAAADPKPTIVRLSKSTFCASDTPGPVCPPPPPATCCNGILKKGGKRPRWGGWNCGELEQTTSSGSRCGDSVESYASHCRSERNGTNPIRSGIHNSNSNSHTDSSISRSGKEICRFNERQIESWNGPPALAGLVHIHVNPSPPDRDKPCERNGENTFCTGDRYTQEGNSSDGERRCSSRIPPCQSVSSSYQQGRQTRNDHVEPQHLDVAERSECPQLNRAIVELLRLHNAEIRMGGPPPSPAERKLKASIAAMRKKTGE